MRNPEYTRALTDDTTLSVLQGDEQIAYPIKFSRIKSSILSGFTEGSVLFAGAGGVVSEDNANLFWDDANNRLGIGTTNPDHKLHVVSSEQCPALFESTTAGGGIALMDSTTTDDAQVGIGAFGNNLCFRSGGSAAGNMRLLANGNFGIGTTTPATRLEIADNTPIVRIASINTNAAGTLSFYDNTAGAQTGGIEGSYNGGLDFVSLFRGTNPATHNITLLGNSTRFIQNGFERVRFTSNGLSGFNTGAPNAAIHVVGTGTTSSANALLVQNSAASDLLQLKNDGNFVLNNKTPNTFYANFYTSNGVGRIGFSESTAGGHPSIYGYRGDGSPRFVLNTNGVSYFTGGNVIIGGTADNGNTFQINGNQNVSLSLVVGQTALLTSTRFGVVGAGTTSATYTAQFHNSTGSNNALVIRDDGRVGIGTSSPARKLVVQDSGPATFALHTTRVSNVGELEYSFGEFDFLGNDVLGGLTAPVPVARIAARADTESSVPGGELAFYTNGSGASQTQEPAERMRITSTGLVGIGTTTPDASSLLDIRSTTQGFLPPRMTTAEKIAIVSPATGLMVYDTTLNKLCVYTTAWETITSV